MKTRKNIEGGATIWARKTLESDIFYWKPDKWFKIWFYIVSIMNHKDNKLFPRGTNFTTYKDIENTTKATRGQVDSFIRWAKEVGMLTTKKTIRGFIITVLNYDYYQDLDNYKYDDDTTQETKQTRNINDTINKNEKMKESLRSEKELSFKRRKEKLISEILGWEKNHPPLSAFSEENKRKFLNGCIKRLGLEEVEEIFEEVETTTHKITGYSFFIELLPEELRIKSNKAKSVE